LYQLLDTNVVSGTTYRYRLYSISFDGAISCQNDNIITVEFEDNRTITLSQNKPNPFSSETNITINIPTAQKVTLEILDIFGRTIKTLVNGETLKGEFPYTWNGRDENGMRVSDGHYLYRLTAGETIITRKLSFISNN
jgi:flagellar hook assembly protein FlgD